MDKTGTLKIWAHFDLDDRYWQHLISGLGNSLTSTPHAPPRQPPPPSRARVTPSKTPLERAAPSPPRIAYNVDELGEMGTESLGILNIIGKATEREVKKDYRKIARIYHPDRHCPDLTGMSPNQAEEYFKLFNNAYNFLRSNA